MKLIDADDLFKRTCNTALYDNQDEDIFLNLILDSPEINTKPIIYAHWIEKKTPDKRRYFECSNCHSHENKHTAIKGKYCWSCGATMNEDVEYETN